MSRQTSPNYTKKKTKKKLTRNRFLNFRHYYKIRIPQLEKKTQHQMPAPRKALASCKGESERREGIDKLKAIKTKHAPKALELVLKALCAVKELQALAEVMSEEAMSAVHAQCNKVFSEFKLTFEAADSDLAAEMDHEFIGLEDCEQALKDVPVCQDALAA